MAEAVSEIEVRGMSCVKCAARVEAALAAVAGVRSVRVVLASERAVVEGTAPAEALVAAVRAEGFEAAPSTALRIRDRIERRREARRELERYWRRKCWHALLAIPVFVVSMGPMLGLHSLHNPHLEFVLATLALLFLAPPFYRKGLPDLLRLRFDMDSMISLGSLLAYVASTIDLVRGGTHFYFEDAVAILAFLTVGRYMEARAKGRAAAEVEGLIDLTPPRSRILRDGDETEVPTEAVAAGDIVVIRPGEKATVDGTIVEGAADADESILTGESLPVPKRPGDSVIAGSLLHGGRLLVRAERTGEETSLGEIMREMERIAEKRTRYQDLADRAVAVFMPIVLATAAATFLGWWIYTGDVWAGLRPTVAVLVIACPCAIGIAIPVAVSVGAAVAARHGILLRDPAALDRIPSIRTFVFDKTGSVTHGMLRLGATRTRGIAESAALRLAAAVESASEHPIGRALVAALPADSESPRVEEFRAEPGCGVSGLVEGWRVRVGRPEWVEADSGAGDEEWIRDRCAVGMTVFAASFRGAGGESAEAFFALEDAPREEAAAVVRLLKERGYRTLLLSGDRKETVAAIGARLGFDEVRAGVLPAEKAAVVRGLRSESNGVAMLGDGVNDAPALAEADLGIAMASGSSLAVEAGAAALHHVDLHGLIGLLDVGLLIRRKARQNLFWAIAYNALLIPAAAAGVASPMWAAVAMALSDVTVIANALLIGRMRFRRKG